MLIPSLSNVPHEYNSLPTWHINSTHAPVNSSKNKQSINPAGWFVDMVTYNNIETKLIGNITETIGNTIAQYAVMKDPKYLFINTSAF